MAVDINAGIADLATAVTALTLQASTLDTTLNVRMSQMTTAIDNMQPDCGCPGQGVETPTGSVVEADPPPTGYGTWPPAIDERKCKLANMLWDDIYNVTSMLDANDVEAIAALGVGSLTALFGLVIALLVSGPVAWGLATLGAIAGLIAFFLLESVNLNNLLNIMDSYHEELVCAFYESTDSQGGLDAFQTVLLGAGASAAIIAYIDALNMIDAIAVLYFQPDGAMGETIEQRLDGYPMAIDCVSCVPPLDPMDWKIAISGVAGATSATGFLGSGIVDNDGNNFVINTVEQLNQPGSHIIILIVKAFEDDIPTNQCISHSGVFDIISSPSGYSFNQQKSCPGGGDCGNTPQTVQMSQNGQATICQFIRQWTSPRSVTFNIVSPPTAC